MSIMCYDIVIAGGGITGAGIFSELSDSGLKVCIIEKNDFASGTSSKSSKLVHGGLRYLKQGNFHLTMESVHHREKLLKEAPGLVSPIEFIMPLYKNESPGKMTLGAGLALYDLMALKKNHSFIDREKLIKKIKHIKKKDLHGGYSFKDALTDDSRLVIQLINKGLENPYAEFKNYCEISGIKNKKDSRIKIVSLKDENGRKYEIKTKLLINSTGPWAENFHRLPEKKSFIRPLKGSHLIIKKEKLDINFALSFLHPEDKRPVFIIPWEGVILVGTTDIDTHSMDNIKINADEKNYLLRVINKFLPEAKISNKDIISTFSGIRPVISSGEKDPSQESREHLVWEKEGIISVTGGKLTTFRKLAWDTLEKAKKYFPGVNLYDKKTSVFSNGSKKYMDSKLRLYSRYGKINSDFYEKNGLLNLIPGTETYYAEIDIASKDKTIKHLDDLLMRRLRLGLILANGGLDIIDTIRSLSQKNLGWDNNQWEIELERYKKIYNHFYSPC